MAPKAQANDADMAVSVDSGMRPAPRLPPPRLPPPAPTSPVALDLQQIRDDDALLAETLLHPSSYFSRLGAAARGDLPSDLFEIGEEDEPPFSHDDPPTREMLVDDEERARRSEVPTLIPPAPLPETAGRLVGDDSEDPRIHVFADETAPMPAAPRMPSAIDAILASVPEPVAVRHPSTPSMQVVLGAPRDYTYTHSAMFFPPPLPTSSAPPAVHGDTDARGWALVALVSFVATLALAALVAVVILLIRR